MVENLNITPPDRSPAPENAAQPATFSEDAILLMMAANAVVELDREVSAITDPTARSEASRLLDDIRGQIRTGGRVSLSSIFTQIESARQMAVQANDSQSPARSNYYSHLGYALSLEARERVAIRRQDITADNIEAFVSSFMRKDLLPEVREMFVEDALALMDTPVGQDIQLRYNATSQESRTEVLEATEETAEAVGRIRRHPHGARHRRELDEAVALGTISRADVQEAIIAAEQAMDANQPTAMVAPMGVVVENNREQRALFVRYAPLAINRMDREDRAELAQIGTVEQIVARGVDVELDDARSNAAQRYLRDSQRGADLSGYTEETRRDALASRVFNGTQTLVLIDTISQEAQKKDLEKTHHRTRAGYGYELEERTQEVFELVKGNPEFVGVRQDILYEKVKRTLLNADQTGVSLKDLGALDMEKKTSMAREIGKKQNTATNTMMSGVFAMVTNDKEAADRAALSTGRGVKNTLREIGVDPDAAQEVGASVTRALKDGAEMAGQAHDVLEHTMRQANEVREAGSRLAQQGAKFIDDRRDRAADGRAMRTKEGRELNDLLSVFQADKRFNAMFDTDKDGKIELHELQNVLNKKYDMQPVNADGEITRQELMGVIAKGPSRPVER